MSRLGHTRAEASACSQLSEQLRTLIRSDNPRKEFLFGARFRYARPRIK